MRKGRTTTKLITTILVCLTVIVGGFGLTTTKVSAIGQTAVPVPEHKYESGAGTNLKMKDWVPGVNAIGEMLLVGSNGVVDTVAKDGLGAEVKIKSVVNSDWDMYDYWLQGVYIDSRWVSFGNMQHLYNLYNSPICGQGVADNSRVGWPSNAYAQEYIDREGTSYEVVAYDDKWVIFWSDGLKGYSGIQARQCYAYMLMRTHQAGFYKVERSKVLLSLYAEQQKAPNNYYAGEGYVTAGTLAVYNQPGDIGTGRCSNVGLNAQVYVVDPTPVPSVVAGNTGTYYKILFSDCNQAGYMNDGYYYGYVNSMFINYEPNGSVPANTINCKIVVDGGGKIPVYSAKDTNSVAIGSAYNNTVLYSFQDQSDSAWTAVLFSGKVGYVPSKNVGYGVANLKIETIKSHQYVLSWDETAVKCVAKVYSGDTLIWTSKEISGNQVTIPNSCFNKAGGNGIQEIGVRVMAVGSTSNGEKLTLKRYAGSLAPNVTAYNTQLTVDTIYDCYIQYATNSSFKNAKTVRAKNGSKEIKNLKKNTTYYVRYAINGKVKTAQGEKVIRGAWSKVKKIKTKNITVKAPVLKTVSGGKKSATAKWTRPKGQIGGYEVIFATDKKFKKNVKKMDIPLASYTKWTQTKLKAKKTYYVKVRAYWDQGNVYTYSKWSKVKKVKTK